MKKEAELQTAHRSMFNTNVSPFGRLQCRVDIGQYLVKLGRLQDHIYICAKGGRLRSLKVTYIYIYIYYILYIFFLLNELYKNLVFVIS